MRKAKMRKTYKKVFPHFLVLSYNNNIAGQGGETIT